VIQVDELGKEANRRQEEEQSEEADAEGTFPHIHS
jgi:hypothetical protein